MVNDYRTRIFVVIVSRQKGQRTRESPTQQSPQHWCPQLKTVSKGLSIHKVQSSMSADSGSEAAFEKEADMAVRGCSSSDVRATDILWRAMDSLRLRSTFSPRSSMDRSSSRTSCDDGAGGAEGKEEEGDVDIGRSLARQCR